VSFCLGGTRNAPCDPLGIGPALIVLVFAGLGLSGQGVRRQGKGPLALVSLWDDRKKVSVALLQIAGMIRHIDQWRE